MKHIIFLITTVLLISCNSVEDKNDIDSRKVDRNINLSPTYDKVTINSKILNLIRDFIKEDSCKKCVHLIYIDKIGPNYSEIILKSGKYNESYIKNIASLFTLKIDSTEFYLITGVEDILYSDQKRNTKYKKFTGRRTFNVWTIKRDTWEHDSITVKKGEGEGFMRTVPPNIIKDKRN